MATPAPQQIVDPRPFWQRLFQPAFTMQAAVASEQDEATQALSATQRLASRGGLTMDSPLKAKLHAVLEFMSTNYEVYTRQRFPFMRLSKEDWKAFFSEHLDPATAEGEGQRLEQENIVNQVIGGLLPYLGMAPQPQGYAPQPMQYAPQPQGYAPQPMQYAPQPQGYAPQPMQVAAPFPVQPPPAAAAPQAQAPAPAPQAVNVDPA